MPGKETIKNRLERRKLLTAIGSSPIAASTLAKQQSTEELEPSNSPVGTVKYGELALVYDGDFPNKRQSHRDDWKRYRIAPSFIELSTAISENIRQKFKSESAIIRSNRQKFFAPPVRFPEKNSTTSLPIALGGLDTVAKTYPLAEPHSHPTVDAKFDDKKILQVDVNSRNDRKSKNITPGDRREITLHNRKIAIDPYNKKEQEITVVPRLLIKNYGMIAVYNDRFNGKVPYQEDINKFSSEDVQAVISIQKGDNTETNGGEL